MDGARLQKKNEQMSAGILMASYTSPHLIPLCHLLKKGLLTKVREQQGGYRYVTSHEQALALGVTQDETRPDVSWELHLPGACVAAAAVTWTGVSKTSFVCLNCRWRM